MTARRGVDARRARAPRSMEVGRLPVADGGSRPADRVRALLAGLVLLAVLVGVPAALALLVGNPLPTSPPDRTWLTAELSAGAVIRVLAVVLWLLWAHFLVCVITEWRAARAGRVPAMVPLGGANQLAARRLVGAVLIAGGALTLLPPPGALSLASPLTLSALASAGAEGAGAGAASVGTAHPGPGTAGYDGRPGALPAGRAEGDHAEGDHADGDHAGGDHAASRREVMAAVPGPVLADAPAPGDPDVWEGGDEGAAPPAGPDDEEAGDVEDRDHRVLWYEVRPPRGRNHDCLWDIAERHLGDPFRYKEIFALNKNRVQPDGRRLVDADLIHPGWLLRMPPDATGPDISVVEPFRLPAEAPRRSADASVAGQQAAAAPARPATSAPGMVTDAVTGRRVLGGGLLLAGLLVALTARRGPYAPVEESQAEPLRYGADPDLAAFVDSALRGLHARRTAQGLAMPEITTAHARADRLVLRLVEPVPDPPAPWRVGEDGRSWWVRARDLSELPEREPRLLDAGLAAPARQRDAERAASAPYPALVSIAHEAGHEVLLDLAAAPGPLALTGDLDRAREVAVAIAAELATAPHAAGNRITLVGFGQDLTPLAPAAIRQVPHLDEVLPDAEAETEAARDGGDPARRSGTARGGGHAHVLVLSGPPTPDQGARLRALREAGGRRAPATVWVGDGPGARWRLVVAPDGTVELGELGLHGPGRRLSGEDSAALLELFRDADRHRAEGSRQAARQTPRAAALAVLREARRRAGLAPGLGPDDPGIPEPLSGLAGAAVLVRLLGKVEVDRHPELPATAVPVNRAHSAMLTELVVLAALHRHGLHDAVLRASIWPRGVSDDVVRASVHAVQEWLGTDAAGEPRFRRDPGGRWVLADDVRCDWDVFVAAAARSARVADEAATLREALGLARGEVFSGVPAGRYGWLAFGIAGRQARVLATAVARRAGGLAVAAGDRDRAVVAVGRGLELVPTSEVLWRDMLRLASVDGPDAVAEVAHEMYGLLAARGVRPEPETDALVASLVPGLRLPAG